MAKKQTQLDARGYRKFGMLDKLSYASGDFACNMSFALKSYLMVFWTQYMGITEATYALLLVLVQVWDAVNDPLLGAVIDADRRKYKHGKFKACGDRSRRRLFVTDQVYGHRKKFVEHIFLPRQSASAFDFDKIMIT